MSRYWGILSGVAAMALVGSSAAVLAGLTDYPTFGGQLLRYSGAALVLLLFMRLQRVSHLRLSPREAVRLTLLAGTGLAGFNVCYVQAVRHADPSSVGAVIGGVPIMLALLAPLLRRRPPSGRVVTAAIVVTAGVVLTQGYGGGSVTGLAWALGALAAEVAFSLLAVPLLPRLGPLRVSTYASALAVPVLLIAAVFADGQRAVPLPTMGQALGLAYLAVVVTALAFVLWYGAISRLGADRAGLAAGIAPASAVAATALLGTGYPSSADIVGAVVVGIGVTIGLAPARTRPENQHPEPLNQARSAAGAPHAAPARRPGRRGRAPGPSTPAPHARPSTAGSEPCRPGPAPARTDG